MHDLERQAWMLRSMEEDGYILEVVPHNQLAENAKQAEEIEKGWQKKITYTATIFDAEIEDLIDARSCETFIEALNWALEWYTATSFKRNKK